MMEDFLWRGNEGMKGGGGGGEGKRTHLYKMFHFIDY